MSILVGTGHDHSRPSLQSVEPIFIRFHVAPRHNALTQFTTITSKNHPLGDVRSPALQVYCSSRQRSEKCLYGFVFFYFLVRTARNSSWKISPYGAISPLTVEHRML
jgi:hypothetical protein